MNRVLSHSRPAAEKRDACIALMVIFSLICASVDAQTSVQQAVPTGPASCVDIRVNDHPALSYACLNQHLAAAAANANDHPSIQLDALVHAPGNRQLGQFNFSAFSIRMGGALGKSVVPQRPPSVLSLPLFGMPVPAH